MYGQYSVHIYRYTLNFKFSLILYLYHSSQWRSIRYYCSSNSTFLFQLENYIYCDVWTIFSPYFTIHFEFQIFIDIVSISFISMKIYQILVQLQINLFSSIGKLHLLWCMDNIQSTFYRYTLNFKFSLILYLYHSSQWRSIRYYCSSNSTFLVQMENYIYCDVWTIFSPHLQIHFEFQIFIDIVSISFISMKIHQILLQLQLNLFISIGKLHLLWCMDNIQSIFYNTLWISNFHWYCIYIIHFNEDLSDISAAPNQSF